MKKVLVLIGVIFLAHSSMAQTIVKKVPFLPYTGAATIYKTDSAGNVVRKTSAYNQPFTAQPIYKPYETIFFENDTAAIRKDQLENLKKIANRLKREGAGFVSFVGFSTPTISSDRARERVDVAISAMKDLGMQNTPVVNIEYKKHPVLNPNRVEVYMRSSGLGSTSSGFGRR